MSVRPVWILTLALPLLAGPAAALPCFESSCRVDISAPARTDARGLPSLELAPIAPRGRWYGVSHHLPVSELPPGLAKRDSLPRGLRTRIEWTSSAKPDLVMTSPGSAHDRGTGVAAVPEPTGAVLFASGLLVAAAAARRVRQTSGAVVRA